MQKNLLRPFSNGGVMIDGMVWTAKVEPNYSGDKILLGDVIAKGQIASLSLKISIFRRIPFQNGNI